MAAKPNFGKNDGLGTTNVGSWANQHAVTPAHAGGHSRKAKIKHSARKAMHGAKHSRGAKIH